MRRKTLARAGLLAAVAGTALLVLSGCTVEGLRPVTDQGDKIFDLFMFTFVLAAIVLLIVVGVLTYNLVHFRERPGAGPASTTTGNKRLEIAWTLTPFIVLTILFILAVRVMNAVDDPPPTTLNIDVIGHQWWWEFRYPGTGVVTANELHVPVGETFRLSLTGADVIHSFWVPRFGWKIDTIPGKTNYMTVDVDKAGTYDGTCTQYCGAEHAWMRILVVAQPPAQFNAWVKQQAQPAQPPTNAVAAAGLNVFLRNTCVSCHTIRGEPATGNVGPDLTHVGSRETLGAGVITNTPANMTEWIRSPQHVKPGVLMPNFNLSDQDLQALVRYLEGLK